MSQWHRENPELAGHPDFDPWMRNEGYRKVAPMSEVERDQLRDEVIQSLPQATRRCYDCGIAYGPCQCTREFGLFEQAMEDEEA